jgi:hypothetical protein
MESAYEPGSKERGLITHIRHTAKQNCISIQVIVTVIISGRLIHRGWLTKKALPLMPAFKEATRLQRCRMRANLQASELVG